VERRIRLDIHLVDIETWTRITGEEAPETPVNEVLYRNHGYPWLEQFERDPIGVNRR